MNEGERMGSRFRVQCCSQWMAKASVASALILLLVSCDDRIHHDFPFRPRENRNCLDCHGSKAKEGATPILAQRQRAHVHPYFREKDSDCEKCHVFHRNAKRNILKDQGVPNLCYGCHKATAEEFKSIFAKVNVTTLGTGAVGLNEEEASVEPDIQVEDLTFEGLCRYIEKYLEAYCRRKQLDPETEAVNWQRRWQMGLQQAMVERPTTDEQSYINKIVIQKHECFNIDTATPEQLVEGGRILLRYRDAKLVPLKALNEQLTGDNLRQVLVFLARETEALKPSDRGMAKDKEKTGTVTAQSQWHSSRTGPSAHMPVLQGDCMACHEPHASESNSLLRNSDAERCLGCHKNIRNALAGTSVHAPAGRFECGSCHRSHVSEQPALLISSPRTLCVECHNRTPGFEAKLRQAHGSALPTDGGCERCHDPHGSSAKHLLRPKMHEPVAARACEKCHRVENGALQEPEKAGLKLCSDCHTKNRYTPVAGETGHPPAAQGKCLACHDAHGSTQSALLRGPQRDLCGECHPAVIEKLTLKYPHRPVAGGNCKACHAPHYSKSKGLLREDYPTMAKACEKCHEEERKPAAPGVLHKPLEEGRCDACHDPHGSDFEHQLKHATTDLCRSCHEKDLAPGGKAHSKHPPVVEGKCDLCHTPHSSPGAALVDKEERMLCLPCHRSGLLGQARKSTHKPVQEGACRACHTSHSGAVPHMLKDPQPSKLCLPCHPTDKLAGGVTPHTAVSKSMCLGCHAPHNSGELHLLLQTGAELCEKCHVGTQREFSRKYVHDPVRKGACNGCHAPHGQFAGNRTLKDADTLCQDCHQKDGRQVALVQRHMTVDVSTGKCLACHSAHAEDAPGLLRSGLHRPVAERKCEGCHKTPSKGELLKPVGGGALCASCHEDMIKTIKAENGHFPAREGNCALCHLPHGSRLPHLLPKRQPEICFDCHDETEEKAEKNKFPHRPFTDGQCSNCHNPHKPLKGKPLSLPGGQACFACHKKVQQELTFEYKHYPAKGQCLECHGAHGADFAGNRKRSPANLCTKCHELADLEDAHKSLPINGEMCTTCHSPHGSPKKMLVLPTAHAPVYQKGCLACHVEGKPTPENPKRLKAAGSALCYDCHTTQKERFAAGHVHPPVAQGQCMACHAPHSSQEGKLLRETGSKLCFSCHSSDFNLKDPASVHRPVAEGKCVRCHEVHTGQEPKLMRKVPVDLCRECHEDKDRDHPIRGHPMGQIVREVEGKMKVVRVLNCTECHDPHRAKNKALLKLSGCGDCHVQGRGALEALPKKP